MVVVQIVRQVVLVLVLEVVGAGVGVRAGGIAWSRYGDLSWATSIWREG